MLIVLVALAAAWGLSYLWLNKTVVSRVEVQNPEGDAGTALVVDHPGRGSFHVQVVSGDDNYVNTGQNKALAVQMAAQAARDLPLPENATGESRRHA